jgi:2'-5' RNA ligase
MPGRPASGKTVRSRSAGRDAGRVPAADLPGMPESAILVPVPEAGPVVERLRARLDRSASRGVPAHVTVLYPFVPPQQITAAVIEMAAAAVKSVPGFGCRFAGTDWFGEDVLWLAPEPAGPFRALTAAVHAAFPQYPPFGGAFADVIPHLTVGDRPEGGISALHAAQAQVLPMLPVRTHVSCAWLMTGTRAPASWQRLAAFPLGQ